MMPDWGKKIILGCTTTIALMMVCEMMFRVFAPSQEDIYRGDTATVWYLKPKLNRLIEKAGHSFQLKTNDVGFRGDNAKDQGGWLFLGCSTTLGWGVENGEDFVSIIGDTLSVSVHNGGQPGWSTHQAVLGVGELPAWPFEKVFVGYGVRDAQLAAKEDRQRQPTPLVFSLRSVQVLQRLRPPSAPKKMTTARVSPAAFRDNLQAIQQHFSDSEVILYAFPQVQPKADYDKVISDLGGVVWPQMGREMFFPDDEIHLNKSGHRQLSSWFVERWGG